LVVEDVDAVLDYLGSWKFRDSTVLVVWMTCLTSGRTAGNREYLSQPFVRVRTAAAFRLITGLELILRRVGRRGVYRS
jgi:hypothetical protein